MTADQIKNFRQVLLIMIGPWALMMPDEDVVRMRDTFQARLDAEARMEEKLKLLSKHQRPGAFHEKQKPVQVAVQPKQFGGKPFNGLPI